MTRHDIVSTETSYRIVNRSHETRVVQIHYELPNNSELHGADSIEVPEGEEGAFAVFEIAAGQERAVTVSRSRPQSSSTKIETLEDLRSLARLEGLLELGE